MKQTDYIIVGQGLAGTLLAHFLLKSGKSVQVFDPGHWNASSKVAAGIINPVTGRRVVKSWMVDELIPFAKKTYEEIEDFFNEKIYFERNIVRALFSIADENLWLEKTADSGVEKYVTEPDDLNWVKDKIYPVHSFGEIQQSAQVDMPKLLNLYRDYLISKENYISNKVDYQSIKFNKASVVLDNVQAKKIIFCEGQQGRSNPLFKNLPFEVAKGEILLVKIPGVNFSKILKHKLFIAPLRDDIYWVGSTYDWDSPDDLPTEEAKQLLIHKLKKILTVPFEVINHQAAIRPTTFDRRPFIGLHPENKLLGIFNGLGTKGASLAPYFADQFVNYLLQKNGLCKEANINRF